MGFLSKVWKGVKKVGSGIVKGITKIGDALTGGNFSKWLSKGWVQKALMAASLLTGGIAIIGGVMQGFSAATAASGFANKFVAGATGFVKGVAAGLANPVGKGKEILGAAGDALGMGGQAAAASEGALAAAEGGAASGLLESSGAAVPTSTPVESMLGATGESIAPQSLASTASQAGQPVMSAAANPSFDMLGAGADASAFSGDALASQVANAAAPAAAPAAEGGWLQSLKSGASDFIKSPMGQQTAASAVSGWAQGQALEEQWNRMEDERKRKRATWDGFASRAPQMDMPSLQSLRDRRQQMYNRGDLAQAKFGY